MTPGRGYLEGRLEVVDARDLVRIGAGFEQDVNRAQIALRRGEVQWRVVVDTALAYVGAGREQHRDELVNIGADCGARRGLRTRQRRDQRRGPLRGQAGPSGAGPADG